MKVISLITILFLASSAAFADYCTFNNTIPALPSASCLFPTCPTGDDCLPPTITKTTATITYLDPLIVWQQNCSDKTVETACWQASLQFDLDIAATDPSGVSKIGVNLAQEVAGRRVFQKFWGTADPSTLDSQGRYDFQ